MNALIRAAMARQSHLVTREQALAAGLGPEVIDRRVRRGDWVAVRRGVYADSALLAELDSPADRQRLIDDAACLRLGIPHVRSHDSAAIVHGMPILLPESRFTHVTRRDVHSTRNTFRVKVHRAPYDDSQLTEASGVRCLDMARTAADVAREHGHPYGVVAFDSALRLGVPLAALEQAVEPMKSWPNVRRTRAELALAEPGTDSVGETLARMLVVALGFGEPEVQFGLTDGRRTAWADLRLGRHLFEFDGKVKYGAQAQPGKTTEQVLWEEKQRQDWLTGFKLGISRIVYADYFDRYEYTLDRLTREYLETCRRFGTAIDDLTPYRVTRPRPRNSFVPRAS